MMRAELTLLALLPLVACGPTADEDSRPSTSGRGSTTQSSSTSTGPMATSVPTTSSDATSSGNPTSTEGTTQATTGGTGPLPPPGYLNQPDVGSQECSTWSENCPAGEKCMPVWVPPESWACRPVVPDPAAVGESCSMTMRPLGTGYDTCEKHSLCWNIDSDSGEGTCLAMCVGTESTPACLEPDTVCVGSASGYLNLCHPSCDPLLQNCSAGDACYPIDAGFICAPDASGKAGGLGESCASVNGCDAGLWCAPSGDFCGKDAFSCCTPFCDLTAPDCPDPLVCEASFEVGEEPPGQENIGLCRAQ